MARLSADQPFIHPDCQVTNSSFGAYVEIGAGSRIAHSEIGDYSYCDRGCDIANAQVGKFSNIASAVRIGATDHPMTTASLHHFLYRSASYWDDVEDDAAWFEARKGRRAQIGHDTWIGHGAIILPGRKVGTGAVVGAGAVVTKDVAPYEIVVGNPAKRIRMRFPDAIIDRLLGLAWWDWSHERLGEALGDFRTLSAQEFLERHQDG